MKVTFNTDDSAEPNNVENVHVESKTERQELSIRKFREAKGVGTFNLVPRFGKTRLGLKIIEKVLNKSKYKTVIIVTPNAQVRSQWKLELNAYNVNLGSINVSSVLIMTRTTFNKIEFDSSVSLIVYDEIHKYLGSELTYAKMVEYKNAFILGLTGTIPDDSTEVKRLFEIAPVIDTINEEDAIRNNWINPYTEYNLSMEFPCNRRSEYIKFSNHINETLKIFRGTAKQLNQIEIYDGIYFGFKSDYAVVTACLAGKKDITSNRYVHGKEVRDIVAKANGWSTRLNLHTDYDKQIEEVWAPDAILRRVLSFNNFVRERTEILTDDQRKLEAILKLVNKYKDFKILVYVGSIDMAEAVTDAINNVAGRTDAIAFHSKIASRAVINPDTGEYYKYATGAKKGLPKVFGKKKLKDLYIDQLNSGNVRVVVTVESLNEGLNVPGLNLVIASAGSTNSITHRQRAARVKTVDETDLSKVSMILNLYFDNFTWGKDLIRSRDKAKLLLRQVNNDSTPTFLEYSDFVQK